MNALRINGLVRNAAIMQVFTVKLGINALLGATFIQVMVRKHGHIKP